MLLEHGLTAADTDIVIDVASHAVTEALRAMERVTNTAPDHLYAHAAILAFILMEKHANEKNAEALSILVKLSGEA
jgi:hypothetical protein